MHDAQKLTYDSYAYLLFSRQERTQTHRDLHAQFLFSTLIPNLKVVLHEILNICSEILKWFLSCFFDTHPFDHGWNWFSSSRWPSILSTWNSHSSCCICSSRWISTLSLSSDYNCRRLQWISESIFVTRCWISFTQSWIIRVILYGPVHLALTWGFSSEDPPQVQQSLDHWSWGERPL